MRLREGFALMPWVSKTVLDELTRAHNGVIAELKQVISEQRYLVSQQAALINQLREKEDAKQTAAPTAAKTATVTAFQKPSRPASSLAAVQKVIEESEAARKA
jgi:uncharacterized coiled-coil protein SlyX